MNSDTGIKPPLHRRFDENKALEFICNRYRYCRNRITKQVKVLQKDATFREKCKEYYKKGYKDWVILTAILNCMINFKAQEMGLNMSSAKIRNKFLKLSNMLQDTVYPTNKILENMDFQIQMHSILALNTYGFKPRRKDFKPEVVERFLRKRMRHFDFDIPHESLFGEPPGNWPKI